MALMSATILFSAMAASMAIPQSGLVFADAALAARDSDGVAVVKLFVAPDRKVLDCVAVAGNLSKEDNQRVCGKLIGKRALEPASSPDGKPAYGTLIYVVAGTGTVGSAELQANLPADIELDVQTLPGGARSKSVTLKLLLDPAGKVVRCEAADWSGGDYAKTACASLKDQALDIRKGGDGTPVSYVDQVHVDFVSRQASR